MTTFYNFTLKIKTRWAKKVVKLILKFYIRKMLEMPMMLVCMFGLFILR